jgi:hypothetical protein
MNAPVVRGVWVLCVVGVAACSSSSSKGTSSSSSSGSSGSGSGGEGGASSNLFSCGSGSLTGQVRLTDVTSLGPIAGATVSGPGCTTATTDERGYFQAASDPGFVVKGTFSASGYVNGYVELTVHKAGFSESGADFSSAAAAAIFPQISGPNGYVYALIGGDGSDGGPCAASTGSTLSIKGHPELAPSYLKTQTTIDATLTATAGFGAVFGPVPPGDYEVDATKTGCVSVGRDDGYFAFNNSAVVSANTVSVVAVTLVAQ